MELYFAPLACSLATRISLYEAGAADARFTQVDTRAKRIAGGGDFRAVNPLGQVPVLILPDGTVLTESAAIVMHLANLAKPAKLAPDAGTPEHAQYLRLMLFLAANVYMTDLCWYYPHRMSIDPSVAPGIKAQSGIDQRRNWSTLEGIAASGEALLPSGFSAADIYMAMLVSWTELEDFQTTYPRIASIARAVGQNPQIAQVWHRHGIV